MKKAILVLAFFISLFFVGEKQGFRDASPLKSKIILVSHGWHTGIVLERNALLNDEFPSLKQIHDQFVGFKYVEIGWGDAKYYQSNPTNDDKQIMLALSSLFSPNNLSVMHVVGFDNINYFGELEKKEISLREIGFQNLLKSIDNSFIDATPLQNGLYGFSSFYPANGNFNLFSVCNHWVAKRLNDAGLSVNLFLATLPFGLFFDLNIRQH